MTNSAASAQEYMRRLCACEPSSKELYEKHNITVVSASPATCRRFSEGQPTRNALSADVLRALPR